MKQWLRDGLTVYALVDNPEPGPRSPKQVNSFSVHVQNDNGILFSSELLRIAALIQAAPELKAALEGCEEALDLATSWLLSTVTAASNIDHSWKCRLLIHLSEARAALARAKGESNG